MTLRKPLARMLLVCSALFFASTEIFAIGISPPTSYSEHTGKGGLVTFGEGQFSFPPNTIGYHVDALAGAPPIYGFFVSHNFLPSFGSAPQGWSTSRSISAADWDRGSLFSYTDVSNMMAEVNSTTLGSFQSLFGSDSAVLFYGRRDSTGVPISDGSATDVNMASWNTTPPLFMRSESLATQFLAIGSNGQIIDGSQFLATPEPSSLVLGVISLTGLAAFRRRRRK